MDCAFPMPIQIGDHQRAGCFMRKVASLGVGNLLGADAVTSPFHTRIEPALLDK